MSLKKDENDFFYKLEIIVCMVAFMFFANCLHGGFYVFRYCRLR